MNARARGNWNCSSVVRRASGCVNAVSGSDPARKRWRRVPDQIGRIEILDSDGSGLLELDNELGQFEADSLCVKKITWSI